MANREVIIETARWFEGQLREKLPVPMAAAKSGYSLHHFVRLFSGVVGMPPKEYIQRRKLSEAGKELAGGKRRVIEVAFDYGYKDHATFTRAFMRAFGQTPSAVRRGANFEYLPPFANQFDVLPRKPSPEAPLADRSRLDHFDACLLAGFQIRVAEESGEVGRLWSHFTRRSPSIPRRREPQAFRQLATWTEEAEEWVDILVACEMETLDELPLDLIGRVLPACDCLVFEHRGSVARVGESYRAIYAKILPSMTEKPVLPFNFESYLEGAGDPYSEDYRFSICVPIDVRA